jgi:hypothetical protein
MKILLKIMQYSFPDFIKKAILARLFAATADAFNSPFPALNHLSYAACLQTYALFTRYQTEKALQAGTCLSDLRTRLYRNAYTLGARSRKYLGVKTIADVMQSGRVLYRAIGVDMEGDSQGNMVVRNCYFSQFYSAPVCTLISALDDGIFSGLSQGCRLAFSERLTEGKTSCKAALFSEGAER